MDLCVSSACVVFNIISLVLDRTELRDVVDILKQEWSKHMGTPNMSLMGLDQMSSRI